MAERNQVRQDSILCRLGWHAPQKGALWNEGYYFTRCDRCGSDLVRTTYSGWEAPRGYRIVWKPRPIDPSGDSPAPREPARIESAPAEPNGTAAAVEPAMPEARPAAAETPAPAPPAPSLDSMIERAVAALRSDVNRHAQTLRPASPRGDTTPPPGPAPASAAEADTDPEPAAPEPAGSREPVDSATIILPPPAAPIEDEAPAPPPAPEPEPEQLVDNASDVAPLDAPVDEAPLDPVPPAAPDAPPPAEAEAEAEASPPPRQTAAARSRIPDFMDEPEDPPQPSAIESVNRVHAAPPL